MMAKSKSKDEPYQNSDYWESRIAKETWKTYNNAEEQNIDLLRMYDRTSTTIKKELYELAEKAESSGMLTRSEVYRFNKLLGQQGEIFKRIEKLGAEIEKSQSSRMKEAGKKVYGNIVEALGLGKNFTLNDKVMEQMLRAPWHGSFFSKSLWQKMGNLEQALNGIVNDGISTGKTVTEMAVGLSNAMQRSFNDAHRLVRTETINYMNRSALRGYKDAGVKKVQWWAAEDERTCEICGTNHKKEYDIDKAPILPCHPGCRCTWLPVLDDETPKLTEAENAAIVKYVSPDAYVLNDKLRNGYDLSESDEKWINNLDKALYKIPAIQGVVTRSLNFLHDEDRKKFIEMYEVGNKVKYKEYISSSMNEVYNEDGEVQITIYSKNGRDIRSVNPEENEILFMRDTEFESVNIEKLNGKTYIDLVEVEKNEQ